MPKNASAVLRIARYTLMDDVRQKSFMVMCVLSVLGILLVRGCYSGNVVMNGQTLDTQRVIQVMSKVMFHLIALGSMFLSALLTMRVLKRDRDEGMQACILSKPITRRQYVAGKVLGLWALSALFMFALHGLVFILASVSAGALLPQYPAASLVCFLNLLFVVVSCLLLSLLMPDVMAFLSVTCIALVSFVADGIFSFSRSSMGQAMMQSSGSQSDISSWNAFYWLWPQISGTERFGSSLISGEGFPGFLSLYPLVNILACVVVLGALLFRRFDREDIV
ncbi:MAG: ABC transporter permease [Deltaproteobacteria bacterium]